MNGVGFIYDETFLLHTPPAGHPERPERLESLILHLRKTGLWSTMTHIHPTPATEEDILAVHSSEMFAFIRKTAEDGGGILDEGDTHAGRESFNVAMLAAGTVTNAVDGVLKRSIGENIWHLINTLIKASVVIHPLF